MASIQPQGIPKPLTPSDGPATDPLDRGDGVPAAQPRPAAAGAASECPSAPRGADRPAASREPGLPERQPSDAAPPVDDEGPLESLGKAISAPVRDAAAGAEGAASGASGAGGAAGEREGKPR